MMVDSGASETVASSDRFEAYELIMTNAVGTKYSSASEAGTAIVNKGEKVIEVTDEKGVESQVRIQICDGLSPNKILASVSRLVQAGHSVVFQDPQWGSYIQNNKNKYRTYLRQENGAYYLDLWVKKVPVFTRQGM
jgi:hypothetical protein